MEKENESQGIKASTQEAGASAVERLVMGSGVNDRNGVEMLDGHRVVVTIESTTGKEISKRIGFVRFINAAFRFIDEEDIGTTCRHSNCSCVGDFSWTCRFEVLNT